MLRGYAGKLLFVDLTTRKIEEKELSKELAKNFIGGYGIGAKILYDMMPQGADPLGPENILGFITGPTNGTNAFYGGRFTLVHKSPITGGWNDSNSGGFFGPELKKAGYDGIFVKGISEKPVYLWINNGKVELKDGSKLWGMDTKETWEYLKEELDEPKVRVIAIGPSGENISLLACPINDGHRAPGRGGGGAVMGSKRLKAIAVRGTGKIEIADKDRLLKINRKVLEDFKNHPGFKPMSDYGTGRGTGASTLIGDAPVKNWDGIGIMDFGEESAGKITSMEMDKHKVKKYACSKCPVGCGAEYVVESGRWPLEQTERPEYETSASFGPALLCDEEDVILKCNEVCNIYGIDTISSGMTIAWAMECYEKGILSKEELDGIDLAWGNGEAIVAILQKMVDREGCGEVLANGSAYAAKKWGKGEEYLQTASGIEIPAHDPRLGPGLARTYQYDPTPGRHVKGGIGLGQLNQAPDSGKYDYEGTGDLDVKATSNVEVMNCLGSCMLGSMFVPGKRQREYVEAITGIPFTEEDSYNTGLRIFNIRHAFNLREGISPSDTYITPRLLGIPPQEDGPLKGVTVDGELLRKNFFKAMDWDLETGNPSLESLKKLGHLEEVIEDLYGQSNDY